MGLPVEKSRRYTVEEYLRFEETSLEKHEYRDGYIVPLGETLAMAGGSFEHSLVSLNIAGELRQRLKGSTCRVFESNLRIRIPKTTFSFYPDASVICGSPSFDPQDPHRSSIDNPRVIVEVLSQSTEAYDRGEKFTRYRALESLQEYILVSPSRASVETFFRQPDGTWLLTPRNRIEDSVPLRSIQIEIPMAEIYAGVELSESV